MALEPGSQFSGYQVLSRLGAGGMGQVYLVENGSLQRREALKVISVAGAANQDFQQRFTLEARTAAALDHPSIITIYHFGVEQNTPWFTMAYLDGTDLDNAQLTLPEVVTVTEQVAGALDYAHRRQVVHRDIKPGNIVVVRDRDTGSLDRAVVLDFGIAKLSTDTNLTATNAFIGTLAYSAPEVIDGEAATGRSDQYALACTIYQVLAGTAPFQATNPSALMVGHLTKPVPPLSSHRADLAALDPVFARALAKKPEERFADCAGFAAAMRAALESPGATGGFGAAVPGGYPSAGHPSGNQISDFGPPPQSGPQFAGPHNSGPQYPGMPHPGPQHSGPQHPAAQQSGPQPGGPQYSGSGPQFDATQAGPAAGSQWPGGPGTTPYPGADQQFSQPGAAQPMPAFAVASQPGQAPPGYPQQPGWGQPPAGGSKKTGWIIGGAVAAVVVIAAGLLGAWGAGAFSSDSDGTDEAATSAVPSNSTVAVDQGTSCAIHEQALYCWGAAAEFFSPDGVTSTTPVQVDGVTDPKAIDIGGTEACAIVDGKAVCWGSDSRTPTEVPGLTDVTVVSVGRSAATRCAVASGEAYCWGDNDAGQLGDGTTVDRNQPVKVAGLTEVTDIATDGATTCAVAGGAVHCWGDNDYGQIGDGTTVDRSSPVEVGNLIEATRVSTSWGATCAIAGSEAYCWGRNQFGQLGDDSSVSRQTPTRVAQLTDPTDINTDLGVTCAIAGGTTYCWGDNTYAALGTGSTTNSDTPVIATGVSNAQSVSTDGFSTCATTESGQAYCWGRNNRGQIGNGQSGDELLVYSPVAITF